MKLNSILQRMQSVLSVLALAWPCFVSNCAPAAESRRGSARGKVEFRNVSDTMFLAPHKASLRYMREHNNFESAPRLPQKNVPKRGSPSDRRSLNPKTQTLIYLLGVCKEYGHLYNIWGLYRDSTPLLPAKN